MDKKKTILFFIRIMLLLIIIVCLTQIGQAYYLSVRHRQQQEKINTTANATKSQNIQQQTTLPQECILQENEKNDRDNQSDTPVIMERFQTLYAENSDLVGWLTIPDTAIDAPVMQCDDDEYYLHHNFYREKDPYGCLYVKEIADVNTPCTNFIIYGHNMKDGSMFGNLDLYQEPEYYQKHPLITFSTLYEERSYQILAVFLSQVYLEDEDVFKYYQFYQADTEGAFLDFYKAVKELSLYDTGVTAVFGDTFITLSTCAYHVEDGRFVVVAKRVS